jgi:tetratricopeptide (TPR) repeat protein
MAKRQHPRAANRPSRAQATMMVDVSSRRLQIAARSWSSGQQTDAIRLFAEAVREEPNNVRAYVMLAQAYAELLDFKRMEQTMERLVRRAPRHPGVHHYVGELYGNLKLPHRAVANYAQAARLPGAGPPTWMELASLYERSHRLDEAEELIERTVGSGFNLPIVALVRGRIQRRQNRPEQAEATFRTLLERVAKGSDWASQAWGELALMKDQQGDFHGAADAIEQCKRPQRAQEKPYWKVAERLDSQMREVIGAISRDDFRRWRNEASHLEVSRMALLTGFPRSGTTLLEQMLDAHPDLVSSEERDFVGKELLQSVVGGLGKMSHLEALNSLPIEVISQQRQRYFRFMEYLLGEPIAGRMHLDKNPAYNLTIPLVLRFFTELRLIVALRDPRDVVLSCYLRYLPLNAVSVTFLDIERTAERYALDMSAWLKYRELIETPWCEIRYEDTVADAEKQARRALDTLSLPWDNQVLNYRQRLLDRKRVTSPTYAAVAEPIYTRAIGRWRNYEWLLEPAMTMLEPFIREFGYAT